MWVFTVWCDGGNTALLEYLNLWGIVSMHTRQHRRGLARSRLAILTVAAATGAALPTTGLLAGPASASVICTGFPNVSCVFTAVGSAYTWPVPAGVTSLTVTADGGAGANSVSTFVPPGGPGGPGGEYQATLTGIPAGTSLSVYPGSAGSGTTGGANQSGQGGNAASDTHGNSAGGGGGASTVAVSPYSLSNTLVAAGGGGGGGAESQGASTPATGGTGGGSTTPDGTDGQLGSPRGHGGTPTAGGAGGAAACLTAPTAGTQLNGGNGQAGAGCGFAGGAGGSGYFGGGGAGTGGGGGGGSAYPASTTTIGAITVTPESDSNTNSGPGSVTIDYTAPVMRTHLHLWSEHILGTLVLFAELTGDGTPLQGEPITFGTVFATLCSSRDTNSNGIASCVLTHSQAWLVKFWYGYINARFFGDGAIPPAHAQAFAHVNGFF